MIVSSVERCINTSQKVATTQNENVLRTKEGILSRGWEVGAEGADGEKWQNFRIHVGWNCSLNTIL